MIIRIIEKPEEFTAVEDLQRQVWPGSDVDIVPAHVLLASAHNGGVAIGAYSGEGEDADREVDSHMVGFVFGFPGLYFTPDGPRPKHHSHMLGVHPEYRDRSLGFHLKRAQWQIVRHQGLDLITWTFDPLMSRNAYLNIAKLGAVCHNYLRDVYGTMRDEINAGLPSDRFQVDWWVNSQRVNRRLSRQARRELDLAHYFAAGIKVINPTSLDEQGLPHPGLGTSLHPSTEKNEVPRSIVLVEIPADFPRLKILNPELGLEWRLYTRSLFETLFGGGYIVTDFVHLLGKHPRSYYVLSHGDSTL